MALLDPFAGLFVRSHHAPWEEPPEDEEAGEDTTLDKRELEAMNAAFPDVPDDLRAMAARQSAAAIASALDEDFTWESIDRAGREITHILEGQVSSESTDEGMESWEEYSASFREERDQGLVGGSAVAPVELDELEEAQDSWGQADA